jgi:hypothetical protein
MDGWPAVLSKTAVTSNKNPSSSTQPLVDNNLSDAKTAFHHLTVSQGNTGAGARAIAGPRSKLMTAIYPSAAAARDRSTSSAQTESVGPRPEPTD